MHSQLTPIRLAAAAALALPVLAGAASPGNPPAAQAGTARVVTAYVLNGGAVTPINTVTNKALTQIPTGGGSFFMVITPNGNKVYANGSNSSGEPVVIPIRTATNKPGTQIMVARNPSALGVTVPEPATM